MEELARAKVNLFLRVLHRREDGFHEVESLMAPITLADSLQFESADDFEFRCNDASLDRDDNLVVRAARLFFSETNREPKVRITLQKNIPYGAGLGGGSSDAAATLRGLDRFFDLRLSSEKLRALATELGSDVPFFVSEHAAICRGRGEIIEPMSQPVRFNLLLLRPQFGVPTPWAYSRWKEAREISGANYRPQNFDKQVFLNDLERPVFEKFPFLAHMKNWLLAQAEIAVALMSGSGSTMFAVLRDQLSADAVISRARAELDPSLWAYACETN